MQAMVDFRGLFMDVYIGWPGKVHDARVFVNSSLCHKGMEGTLFPQWEEVSVQLRCVLCIYSYNKMAKKIRQLNPFIAQLLGPLVILRDPACPALL